MPTSFLQSRVRVVLSAIALLVLSTGALADPPASVARLAYVSGAVSFSPAGEDNWTRANINRPLSNGDRLWSDAQSRSEIQARGTTLRMNANTSIAVVNLDDRITQLQLAEGSLQVRVTRLAANQTVEIDTPNLAFTLRQPGEYRISVDPQGDATEIVVRSGRGEAYGDGNAYSIDARQAYRFIGAGLRDYVTLRAPQGDAFDQWAAGRDRLAIRSLSARYVSPDVVGYQDLDGNGNWRNDTTYGSVWTPTRVANDWAPYRDGHWSWVDPWGWTWIDDAPWGFAVSHYGRWARLGGRWAWIPGPLRVPAYYAPAVVAFVGGSNFQIASSGGNVGGVGWFPLGPREVYRPSYQASRAYVDNINHSNTVVNTVLINNTYNVTQVTQEVHANRRVPGAVTTVPRTVFEQSQPVARAAVRLAPQVLASAVVAPLASVVPTERSVHGGAAPGERPPARALDRKIIARTAAPPAHSGFAAQQAQLAAHPGQPLDDGARKALKPAATVPLPAVTVVTPVTNAPPVAPPPSKTPPTPAASTVPSPTAAPLQTPASGPTAARPPPRSVPAAVAAAAAASAAPPAAQSGRVAQPAGNPAPPPVKALGQAPAPSTPPSAARPAAAAPAIGPAASVPAPKAEPAVPAQRTPPSRGLENRPPQRAPSPTPAAPQIEAVAPIPPVAGVKPPPKPAPPVPAAEAPTPAATVRAAPPAAPAPAPVATPADRRAAPPGPAPARPSPPAAPAQPPTVVHREVAPQIPATVPPTAVHREVAPQAPATVPPPAAAPAPQVAVPPAKADTAPPARRVERRPPAEPAAQGPQPAARPGRGAPQPAASAASGDANEGTAKTGRPNNDKGAPKN